MGFKLTKAESKRRDELVAALEIASGEVSEAVEEANVALMDAEAKANAAIGAYNAVLGEAREFRDELVSRMQEDYDEKSERWQEGEKGSAVSSFLRSWFDLDLDDLDEAEVEVIDDPEPCHRDNLDEMAEGADYV